MCRLADLPRARILNRPERRPRRRHSRHLRLILRRNRPISFLFDLTRNRGSHAHPRRSHRHRRYSFRRIKLVKRPCSEVSSGLDSCCWGRGCGIGNGLTFLHFGDCLVVCEPPLCTMAESGTPVAGRARSYTEEVGVVGVVLWRCCSGGRQVGSAGHNEESNGG